MSTAEASPDARPPRFVVSAAEPSGDLHAAHLVERVLARRPDARFVGFGGVELRAAGCVLVGDLTAVASMGLGWVRSFRHYVASLRRFDQVLTEERPDAVVVVDAPGFHFLLARLARWRGVPVIYYICPQIWAWAPWRRRKVLRFTDLLLPILPFEASLLAGGSSEVRYVGHPIADEMASVDPELGRKLRDGLGLGPEARVLGLFPGSREREIEGLVAEFLRVAGSLELDPAKDRVLVSCFRAGFRPRIEAAAAESGLDVTIVEGDSRSLMQACDLAIVASGTASLQLAYYRKPMVVLYRTRPHLRRWYDRFTVTPFIALPNLLGLAVTGGASLVPEELFTERVSEATVDRARALWHDGPERARVVEGLAQLHASFFREGGIDGAASALLDWTETRRGGGPPAG